MYIVRRTNKHGQRYFKTRDGWVKVREGVALDLSEVLRFTCVEKELNELPLGSEFVWYGSYTKEKEL